MQRERFRELALKFKAWSENADRGEVGWQSDFPEWPDLIESAKVAMREEKPSSEEVALLEEVWSAAEEGEELLEYSKREVGSCWSMLRLLSSSPSAACRWQVYDAISAAGVEAECLLRKGLADRDSYVRRRALLALTRLVPHDARDLATTSLKDPDPYMRQAAIEMVVLVDDQAFQRAALCSLVNDPIDHVRQSAQARLSALGL